MANIDSATNKVAINPALPQASETTTTEKAEQLDSLQARDSNVGDPSPSRLSIKSWISNLFKGGLPSLKPKTATEPKTVTVNLARAKLEEIKEHYKGQIDVARRTLHQEQGNKETEQTRTAATFQRRTISIETTIAEHEQYNQLFSQEDTQTLVSDLKQLHQTFGGEAPTTIFAKQKTKASAIPLTDRKVRIGTENKGTSRFARLKTAFQSFKDFFKGLRPSERNAKTTTSVNQKPSPEQVQHKQTSIEPLQQVGVARTAIGDKAEEMLAKVQAKIEALETELEEKKTEGGNYGIAFITTQVRHYTDARADAQKVFLPMQDDKGATLSNAEVEAFNNNVERLGERTGVDFSEYKVRADADT